MCRVGGPRCAGSHTTSPGGYARRKSNRAFRRDLRDHLRRSGEPALAEQVMGASFTAMPKIVEHLGLDPAEVSCAPMPGQVTRHALPARDAALIETLELRAEEAAELRAERDALARALERDPSLADGFAASDHADALREIDHLPTADLYARAESAEREIARLEAEQATAEREGRTDDAEAARLAAERNRRIHEKASKTLDDRRYDERMQDLLTDQVYQGRPLDAAAMTADELLDSAASGRDSERAIREEVRKMRERANDPNADLTDDERDELLRDASFKESAANLLGAKADADEKEAEDRKYGTSKADHQRMIELSARDTHDLTDRIAESSTRADILRADAAAAEAAGDMETAREKITDAERAEREAHSARAALHERTAALSSHYLTDARMRALAEAAPEDREKVLADLTAGIATDNPERAAHAENSLRAAADLIDAGHDPLIEQGRATARFNSTQFMAESAAKAASAAEGIDPDTTDPDEQWKLRRAAAIAQVVADETDLRERERRIPTDASQDRLRTAGVSAAMGDFADAERHADIARTAEQVEWARAAVGSSEDTQREAVAESLASQIADVTGLKNPGRSPRSGDALLEGQRVADQFAGRSAHWREMAEGAPNPEAAEVYRKAADHAAEREIEMRRAVDRLDDRVRENEKITVAGRQTTRKEALDLAAETTASMTGEQPETTADVIHAAHGVIDKIKSAPTSPAQAASGATSARQAAEMLRSAAEQSDAVAASERGVAAVRSLVSAHGGGGGLAEHLDADAHTRTQGRERPADKMRRIADTLANPTQYSRADVLAATAEVPELFDRQTAELDRQAIDESRRETGGRVYNARELNLTRPLDGTKDPMPEEYDTWRFAAKNGTALPGPAAGIVAEEGGLVSDVLPPRLLAAGSAYAEKMREDDGTHAKAQAAYMRALGDGGAPSADEVKEMARKAWLVVDDNLIDDENRSVGGPTTAERAVTAAVRAEFAAVRAEVEAAPTKWPLLANFTWRTAAGEVGKATDTVTTADLAAPGQEEALF